MRFTEIYIRGDLLEGTDSSDAQIITFANIISRFDMFHGFHCLVGVYLNGFLTAITLIKLESSSNGHSLRLLPRGAFTWRRT